MAIQRLNVEANKHFCTTKLKAISIEETKQETNVWSVLNVLVQFVRTNQELKEPSVQTKIVFTAICFKIFSILLLVIFSEFFSHLVQNSLKLTISFVKGLDCTCQTLFPFGWRSLNLSKKAA